MGQHSSYMCVCESVNFPNSNSNNNTAHTKNSYWNKNCQIDERMIQKRMQSLFKVRL